MAEQLQFDLILSLEKAKRDIDNLLKNSDSKLTPKIDKNQAAKAGTEYSNAFSKESEGVLSKNFSKIAARLSGILITAGITKGIFASIEGARSFETAFTGVLKTVDGLDDGFGVLTQQGVELENQFKNLSIEIPLTFEELASIGEIGGQLGVPTNQLINFTETVAKLGVTTNLSTEEAASSFAKIANVLGDDLSLIDEYGSSVVALGNNLATTERDIVNFANRISGVGQVVGLSADEIFAISGAFSSVGVQAEAGGTAVQKVFLELNSAVQGVGDGAAKQLEIFARTAGLSIEEFSNLFENDAAGAFEAFVVGLGEQGERAGGVLDELGLADQRLIKAFLSLSGNSQILTEALNLSNEAFEENTALTDEAGRRFATTDSQIQLLRNNVSLLGANIGSALLPAFNQIIEAITPIISKFAEFASNNPVLATTILGIVAGLGIFIAILPGLIAGLSALGAAFTIATGPIGLIVIAIAAVVAAVILVIQNWDLIQAKTIEIWNGIVAFFTEKVQQIIDLFQERLRLVQDIITTVFTAVQLVFTTYFNTYLSIVTTILEAIIGFFRSSFDRVVNLVSSGVERIKSVLGTITSFVQNNVIAPVSNAWQGLTNGLDSVISTIRSAFESLNNIFTGTGDILVNGVKGILNGYLDSINNAIGGVNNVIGNFGIKLPSLPRFAEGGLVGSGQNTLAILNDGKGRLAGQEYVVNAPATRQFLPLLEAMNNLGAGNTNSVTNNVTRGSNNTYNNYGSNFGSNYPYLYQNQ